MRISRILQPIKSHSPSILGIDASLTSTGFAYRNSGELFTGLVTSGKLKGAWRLYYIREQIRLVLARAKPDLIVMEDYAQGRGPKMGVVFHIGELGGVLKTMFWESGIDVMLVAPTSLKMIISGKGNAKKPDMRQALLNTFGYDIGQDDEADAAGLMLVGELTKGLPVVSKAVRSTLRLDTLASFPVAKGKMKLIAK